MNEATMNQGRPNGSGVPIVELVKQDLDARAAIGEKKYGQKLKANNGRDALVDAYQEVLDLAKYLRQEIEERSLRTATDNISEAMSAETRQDWGEPCGCRKCLESRNERAFIMICCPTCGNKRCPHASDHAFACTNSNEPGQAGSVFQ